MTLSLMQSLHFAVVPGCASFAAMQFMFGRALRDKHSALQMHDLCLHHQLVTPAAVHMIACNAAPRLGPSDLFKLASSFSEV